MKPEKFVEHHPREPERQIEPRRLKQVNNDVQDRLFDVFFLKIVDERVQPEKDDEGKELDDAEHESREEKGEQHAARKGEAEPDDVPLGKGHHEREHGDKVARRKQKTHIGAERQSERGDGAGDRRERDLKGT